MIEAHKQTFQSVIQGAVVSIADRMQARRPTGRRSRVRHGQITMDQAINAHDGWLFAVQQGKRPTTFVTIQWKHAPPRDPGQHPVERNGLLRDGLKAWLYRNAPGVPFVWIEVREKTGAIGEHAHLVVHVPDHLRERFAMTVDRLVRRQSADVGPTAIDVRPVEANWWGLFAYLMKGGEADVRQRYAVPAKLNRSQGIIEGRRLRIAHAIGPTARRAAEGSATAAPLETAVA